MKKLNIDLGFRLLVKTKIKFDDGVSLLKAAGESTRLRLLSLLFQSDLTVSDLTEILGQSQPRVSRHLRLLVEAGLAERYQEGAWAMFRTVDQGKNGQFVKSLFEQLDLDDRALEKDRERLNAVKERRAQKAAEYFSQNASSWDELRSLHVADEKVEAAILNLLGSQPINDFLDLGTGTGRMLELLSKKYEHGIGVDISHEMMAIARANLEEAGIKHAQVRHGDVFHLPFSNDSYDLIIIHQVLHYLDNPAQVIKEAAKALTPQGRLLIVDFAPHELEFLRDEHAHLRLGFSDEQMEGWLNEAGLNANKSEHLKPDEDAAHPLIVSLWLAQDARTAS